MAYIAVTVVRVEEDVVHCTSLMLAKVLGYRAWCTHTQCYEDKSVNADQRRYACSEN